MQDKLYDIIAKVLQIPSSQINDQISPDNTPEWDSFNAIMMVAELEKVYDEKFSMNEVMAVKNVGDIKKILDKHKIKYER